VNTVVGAYAAKTHLSDLLERVIRGETITISRHGTPVARLTPIDEADRDLPRRCVEGIRRLRARNTLDGLAIKDLVNEGRR